MPWYLSPRLARRVAQRATEGLVLLAGASALAALASGAVSHVLFSGLALAGHLTGAA